MRATSRKFYRGSMWGVVQMCSQTRREGCPELRREMGAQGSDLGNYVMARIWTLRIGFLPNMGAGCTCFHPTPSLVRLFEHIFEFPSSTQPRRCGQNTLALRDGGHPSVRSRVVGARSRWAPGKRPPRPPPGGARRPGGAGGRRNATKRPMGGLGRPQESVGRPNFRFRLSPRCGPSTLREQGPRTVWDFGPILSSIGPDICRI